MNHSRIAFLILCILSLLPDSLLLSAPPPELTVLRQQYEKAVTVPHEAAVSDLNAKFTTALGNAVTAAKQAGKLEEVLAIQEDQKRLADKLPLPDDDEKTPEGLKKLRAIYRDQLSKLEAQRSANHTALLPAYTAKLKDLEASLTKADRIEEAKEVMTYREGLATGVAPPAMAAPDAKTPEAPPAPVGAPLPPPSGKGDDRAAREIDDGKAVIEKVMGFPPTWFRAPYGVRCSRVDRLLAERNLVHFHWDIDPQDWKGGNAPRIRGHVQRQLEKMTGRNVLLLELAPDS